jgi:cytochrome c556
MSRHLLVALLAVICLCAVAVPALAAMPGDVVSNRQRLMRLNGASWADIQAKTKAGNVEAIAVNAETIAVMAQHIPSLFPAGSLTDQSKAKPEIWQRFDEFQAKADTLKTMAEQMRDAAKAKDSATVEAMVKEFGPKACGACHTPFRQPPAQK